MAAAAVVGACRGGGAADPAAAPADRGRRLAVQQHQRFCRRPARLPVAGQQRRPGALRWARLPHLADRGRAARQQDLDRACRCAEPGVVRHSECRPGHALGGPAHVPLLRPQQLSADRRRHGLGDHLHPRRQHLVRHRQRRPSPAAGGRQTEPLHADAGRRAQPAVAGGDLAGDHARRHAVGGHARWPGALDRARFRALAGVGAAASGGAGADSRARRQRVGDQPGRYAPAARRRQRGGAVLAQHAERERAGDAGPRPPRQSLVRHHGRPWPRGRCRAYPQRASVQQFRARVGQAQLVAGVRGPRRRSVVRQLQRRPVVSAGQLAAVLGAVVSGRRSGLDGQSLRDGDRRLARWRGVVGGHARRAGQAGSWHRCGAPPHHRAVRA